MIPRTFIMASVSAQHVGSRAGLIKQVLHRSVWHSHHPGEISCVMVVSVLWEWSNTNTEAPLILN